MSSRPPEPAKVTVLFIGSAPRDQDALELPREVEALTRGLRGRAADDVEIHTRWGVPVTELLDTLEDYQPDILHLSGHGLASGALVFEDEDAITHAPGLEAVARIFEYYEGRVRCVVLNACDTVEQAELIARHVDVVVATSDRIEDRDSLEFTRVFYKELAKGKSVAVAFARAKLGLELRGSSGQALLELCLRTGVDAGTLYLLRAPDEAQPTLAPGPADTLAQLGEELEKRALAGADVSELERRLRELRRQVRSGPSLESGDVLGERYRLDTVLGTGGFGTVWKAFDRVGEKLVAVKVLHGQWARDESRVERFVSGAARLTQLRHPRVVAAHEQPSRGGPHVYCVMPLLAGGDLRQAVLGGLDRRAALAAIADALEGVAFAHEQGVVHRDIKPGNILLDANGRGYITDFDLAHAKDSTQGTRTVGMGTFGYAAPEQQKDAKRVDARADVYAAGMCVLFALLGEDPPLLVSLTEPGLVDEVECGPRLRAAVKAAVTFEVERRTTTCAELVEAIRGDDLPLAPVRAGRDGQKPVVDVALRGSVILAPRGGVELVRIPAGRFMMGTPRGGYDDERPCREVELGEFALARTPVTNAEYAKYLEANPNAEKPRYWGDRRYNQAEQPVVGVSWRDAQGYCDWAGLVLPTEAQWEYACRAGTQTEYWSGDREEDLARVGWYGRNSGGRVHAVAELPANGWGLHDMHGNVYEWCRDGWVDDYAVDPRQGDGLRREPVGVVPRVMRGGLFDNGADVCRSACRSGGLPGNRDFFVGFRPAQGRA